MPPIHYFGPHNMIFELIYTLLIVFLCGFVYFKTTELYQLSKYKGISFFRNAFLFFGLAYAARLLLHLIMLGTFALDIWIPRREIMPLSILVVGYFSTMAILYLTYSIAWKRFKMNHFLIVANVTAIIISAVSFVYRSHEILIYFQLILLAYSVIMILLKRKGKSLFNIRILYLLVLGFWLLNMFTLGPRRLLPFEIKLIAQAISLLVFILITYRVLKWAK